MQLLFYYQLNVYQRFFNRPSELLQIKFPDIIDAMRFPFLEDATSYMVSADAMHGGIGSVAAVAQNKADDLFAGV
ncbi:MAG: hypothetical protein LZF85_08130 [Nitrosomonas sp.]|uniref:hypothetical protein n=1 Tax=Nitrosomonas sp. TaxID=42353 RepID=UPI0025FFE954|nr:hypothetical protein [Nitrosomonas sp.]UJP01764.1 MAG: hypothetical protein LZF85_08130 [Nitrosomonas sp.]